MTRRELIEGLGAAGLVGAGASPAEAHEVPEGSKAVLIFSFSPLTTDLSTLGASREYVEQVLRAAGLEGDVAVIWKDENIKVEFHTVDP